MDCQSHLRQRHSCPARATPLRRSPFTATPSPLCGITDTLSRGPRERLFSANHSNLKAKRAKPMTHLNKTKNVSQALSHPWPLMVPSKAITTLKPSSGSSIQVQLTAQNSLCISILLGHGKKMSEFTLHQDSSNFNQAILHFSR